eukprot:CAMPEP_0179106608 /NCGR_PEP_ID=MMETSP0796-20121207/49580_1 /TAXON_ID=73915 /ORGANISM="Pyrodinium bahamense, Strain pbaha01" /LENGTH=33 /DNA_ID= /DNA_START= /DNA_END= /DNA_ORIENTATION=
MAGVRAEEGTTHCRRQHLLDKGFRLQGIVMATV